MNWKQKLETEWSTALWWVHKKWQNPLNPWCRSLSSIQGVCWLHICLTPSRACENLLIGCFAGCFWLQLHTKAFPCIFVEIPMMWSVLPKAPDCCLRPCITLDETLGFARSTIRRTSKMLGWQSRHRWVKQHVKGSLCTSHYIRNTSAKSNPFTTPFICGDISTCQVISSLSYLVTYLYFMEILTATKFPSMQCDVEFCWEFHLPYLTEMVTIWSSAASTLEAGVGVAIWILHSQY